MDLVTRRSIEQRIVIAVAEGLVSAGCSITVVEGEKVFLADSTDPVAIDAALHASGEPDFKVKRVIDGNLQEGWVDFVGAEGIEVSADENLKVHDALQIANTLAVQLGVQRIPGITFGLKRDDQIYVHFVCDEYSTSIQVEWEPINGGWSPLMTAEGMALKFLATHPMILNIFAVAIEPSMEEVLDALALFGKRHDIGLGNIPTVTDRDPHNGWAALFEECRIP